MEAELPDRIGRYDVLRVIGRGGMGVLYQARDTEQRREVALKVLSPELREDSECRARFRQEALAGRVQHRNIVRILEAGEDGDVPFIAMEFLRGTTLAERLSLGPPLSLRAKLDVVIQMCEGLQCLHEHGIVHRDIKPSNIWITEDGSVKLLDLGIAKQADVQLTQYGGVVGSVEYMAPEQLSGGAIDQRIDIFSAGIVLYELLTGQKLFRGSSMAASMNKVLHEPVPDVRASVPGLSDEVVEALGKALRKNPAERYTDAEELASDLRLARDAVPSGDSGNVRPAPLTADATIIAPRAAAGDIAGSAELYLRPETGGSTASKQPAVAGPTPGPRPAPHLPARSGVKGGLVVAGGVVAVMLLALAWWYRTPSAPQDYVVDVRSTPAGAEISVDGAVTGRRTPAVLTLATRPRQVALSLAGYAPLNAVLDVSSGRRMNVDYALHRLLRVESVPAGAHVLVDGRDTGMVTPAEVVLNDPAPRAIDLQLAGHQPVSEPLTAAAIAAGRVSVKLSAVRDSPPAGPVAGTLPKKPAEGLPSAVTVSLSGTYPFDVSAVSGCGNATSAAASTHILKVTSPCVLRLRAPNYFLDITRSVNASSGAVEMTVPPLVSVQLRSRYQNCTLYVDGRAVGSPPADLEMAVGTYRATIRCPDGQTYESNTFPIEAGLSNRKIDDYLR